MKTTNKQACLRGGNTNMKKVAANVKIRSDPPINQPCFPEVPFFTRLCQQVDPIRLNIKKLKIARFEKAGESKVYENKSKDFRSSKNNFVNLHRCNYALGEN